MRFQIKKNEHKAFTLLELLLGLSIFGMIAFCVYRTFWAALFLEKSATTQNKIYRQARWTFEGMTQELENMVGYDFSASYEDRTAFNGDKQKITFLASKEDGLKIISYYLSAPQETRIHKVIIGQTYSSNVKVEEINEQRADKQYLMRAEKDFASYLAGKDDGEKAEEVEVLAMDIKVNGLRFFYGYQEDQDSGKYLWKEEWTQTYLPSHIRIEIDFLVMGNKRNSKEKLLTITRDVFVPTGALGVEDL